METDYMSLLHKFRKRKILVIGDFILDGYLEGKCTRIAPEGAVPVVDLISRSYCLGGAANAAANLAAMGADVFLCSVIGDDVTGNQARELLQNAGISTDFIISAPERSTIVKTRVKVPSHIIVRYDEGNEGPVDGNLEEQIKEAICQAYKLCDAVLIADYNKGMLTECLLTAIIQLKSLNDKFIAIDSKRLSFFSDLHPRLIKPNYQEAIILLHLNATGESRTAQLKSLGNHFFEKTNADIIALTCDKDGTLFFRRGSNTIHVPAPLSEMPEVSGAGDTFITACMLALICGGTLFQAAEIASAAAGVVINKPGTAICHNYELEDILAGESKYITSVHTLKRKCEFYRSKGKRIVFTNGCFDILHSGHVNYLRKAKKLGDILIVGINKDDSIKRLKGKDRPVNSLGARIEVLSALECVDLVVPFGSSKDDTPISLIRIVRPDIFVKGGDYQHKFLAEEKILRRIDCEIILLPYIYNQSTTRIIKELEDHTRLNVVVAN